MIINVSASADSIYIYIFVGTGDTGEPSVLVTGGSIGSLCRSGEKSSGRSEPMAADVSGNNI